MDENVFGKPLQYRESSFLDNPRLPAISSVTVLPCEVGDPDPKPDPIP